MPGLTEACHRWSWYLKDEQESCSFPWKRLMIMGVKAEAEAVTFAESHLRSIGLGGAKSRRWLALEVMDSLGLL